jgi:hypothetical protein
MNWCSGHIALVSPLAPIPLFYAPQPSTEIYWHSKFSGREINVQDGFLLVLGNEF